MNEATIHLAVLCSACRRPQQPNRKQGVLLPGAGRSGILPVTLLCLALAAFDDAEAPAVGGGLADWAPAAPPVSARAAAAPASASR